MKKYLQELYLSWFNDFLTLSCFAEYYGFSEMKAERCIDIGRRIHEKRNP